MENANILIIGGQGTYQGGEYHSEYPDRNLSLEYMMKVADIARDRCYNFVIPSGGFTQAGTPGLSEAKSFEALWQETQTRPKATILFDEVSLDSAENILYGLMRFREEEPRLQIARIGFLSQWEFKKQRMNATAAALDIGRRFYFFGHATAKKANAGALAETGEMKQFAAMERADDFLLRGSEWEQKRMARYKASKPYAERDAHLREAFPAVFEALDAMKLTTIRELQPLLKVNPSMELAEAAKTIRGGKLDKLREAFRVEVMKGRGVLATV